jgi:hypothetical protein
MHTPVPDRANDLQLFGDDVCLGTPKNPVDVQPFGVDVHSRVPKTPSMFSLLESIFDRLCGRHGLVRETMGARTARRLPRSGWSGLVRETMGGRRGDNCPAAKHTLEGESKLAAGGSGSMFCLSGSMLGRISGSGGAKRPWRY